MVCDPWQELYPGGNQIGDAGVTALAEALAKGAMPKLTNLYLSGNPGSSEPVDKVLRERRSA